MRGSKAGENRRLDQQCSNWRAPKRCEGIWEHHRAQKRARVAQRCGRENPYREKGIYRGAVQPRRRKKTAPGDSAFWKPRGATHLQSAEEEELEGQTPRVANAAAVRGRSLARAPSPRKAARQPPPRHNKGPANPQNTGAPPPQGRRGS
ncbi:hypothetical protein DQ04_13301010, partial [Trypanosoma grayi]|uniref:hypothetical protein n=1 Tax=Trypanosoma grayi TaxID=71804 RepID=UPI0004F41566